MCLACTRFVTDARSWRRRRTGRAAYLPRRRPDIRRMSSNANSPETEARIISANSIKHKERNTRNAYEIMYGGDFLPKIWSRWQANVSVVIVARVRINRIVNTMLSSLFRTRIRCMNPKHDWGPVTYVHET